MALTPRTEPRPGGPDGALHRGARRAHPRYSIHASVELLGPFPATGVVLNLSAGGLRVAVTRALPVGARTAARLVTETGGEILLHARVVWSRSRIDGCLLGLQIVTPMATRQGHASVARVGIAPVICVGGPGRSARLPGRRWAVVPSSDTLK